MTSWQQALLSLTPALTPTPTLTLTPTPTLTPHQALLSLAAHLGFLEPECFGKELQECRAELAAQGTNPQATASQINGMLLCAEMFVASLAHPFVSNPHQTPTLTLTPTLTRSTPSSSRPKTTRRIYWVPPSRAAPACTMAPHCTARCSRR